MTTEKAIENILKEQISSYKALHEVLNVERKCLVDIDIEKIEEVAKEKDTVIMRLRLLEEERQRLIIRFIAENDVVVKFDLHVLAKMTGNETFSNYRSELLALIQGIDEMTKFNAILINRSLSHIRTSSNFVSKFRAETHAGNTGVLLSRET